MRLLVTICAKDFSSTGIIKNLEIRLQSSQIWKLRQYNIALDTNIRVR